MAQQYGLGRGLSSLIPPKSTKSTDDASSPLSRPVPVVSPFVINPKQPIGSTAEPQNISAQPQVRPFIASNAPPKSQSLPVENTALSSDQKPRTGTPVVSPEQQATQPSQEHVVSAPIHMITPNPEQPRVQFDVHKLAELAQSIREHGILQPLVVTQIGDTYELIAGERRLQAAKQAGLTTVPVIVRSADERTKLELAIIENTQRHNLNVIEEAKAYLRLMEEYGLHQESVAKKMGKSRSLVANTIRLLHLPVEIQRAIIEGSISEGHAKALLGIENSEKQRALFELILKSGLTVRESEIQARSIVARPLTRAQVSLPPELSERVEKLREKFGTKVKIAQVGRGGRIIIEYYSTEELTGLFQQLGL